MKNPNVLVCTGLCLWVAAAGRARAEGVRAWQGTLELPTYALGEEDPNPPFPLIVRHSIYPYTMLDDLTDRLENKTYRALYLENEFLKAIILPDLGGRLYSLYDKTSKREVFYRSNVVKYGLVALRGAWVSGGIEFNFPDGHTVVTVSPVASTILRNSDGSATVVVGDVDQVTGMHWEVALTLRPGDGRLDQRVKLFNATELTSLYWFWANAAVPATEDMQFVFPMREAYPHARWPVHTYPNYESVDYSRYKNIRQPTSLFGRQVHRNFFGAYYRDSDCGVVHVADFREVPGKKLWSWGMAGDGLIWTDLLTDRDGPYNEIQSGRYETQLNYEFMTPHRVESWTEYWYPVRGLGGGILEATNELALNAVIVQASGQKMGRVEIMLCPVVEISGVKVRLKSGTRVILEFGPVSLKPLIPTTFKVPLKEIETKIQSSSEPGAIVEVESSTGQILAHWSASDPVDRNPDFVPAAGSPEPKEKPTERMTVDELFLRGVEQEKSGWAEVAAGTYEAVLKRDSGHIPALLKLAMRHYRAADFRGAETLIRRALDRNGIDPAAQYAAGIVYKASERWNLASDAFWTALHYGGPAGPAYAQLGEIAIRQKDYEAAARLLQKALSYNSDDALTLADLGVALRLGGNKEKAARAASRAVEDMPLLPFALAERAKITRARETQPSSAEDSQLAWTQVAGPNVETYLEIAAWYGRLGDFASSDEVLQAAIKEVPSGSSAPMVYYYLASNAQREGRAQAADEFGRQAASAPHEKISPHRLSDAQVLLEAIERNPFDGQAPYFLGNFLFAYSRYDDAAKAWLQAQSKGFEYSVLARNLGIYAWRVKSDPTAAARYYETAIRLAPSDYRLYVDLDRIYLQLNDTASRVKLLSNAPPQILERDTVRMRRVLLLVEQQQYEEALKLLTGHRFKPWEGGEIVRQMYVLAQLEQGKQKFHAGDAAGAEKAFLQATEYPTNLGVGKPADPHDTEALYWLGEALNAQGKTRAAQQAWSDAAAEGRGGAGTSKLFTGLALRKLRRSVEADIILGDLVRAAARNNAGAYDYYVGGLAERYLKREDRAQTDFRRALDRDPSFWQARLELARKNVEGLPGHQSEK